MKHKHSEPINRWTDDTSLVVLYKSTHYRDWRKSSFQISPTWERDSEYFLVCEKHVEVALHWLNGAEVQLLQSCGSYHTYIKGRTPNFNKEYEYRIKPKLEKRWITYNSKTREAYNSGPRMIPAKGFQMIEIEVELN